MWLEQSQQSGEWEMRWKIPAGPGKEFGFYLNYNTMLHGRFFSKYIEDPIYLCRWLSGCFQSIERRPRVQPEAIPVDLGLARPLGLQQG